MYNKKRKNLILDDLNDLGKQLINLLKAEFNNKPELKLNLLKIKAKVLVDVLPCLLSEHCKTRPYWTITIAFSDLIYMDVLQYCLNTGTVTKGIKWELAVLSTRSKDD